MADVLSQILNQGFNGSADQIDQLAKALGLSAEQASKALEQIQQFGAVKLSLSDQFDKLNQSLGLTSDQFKGLSQAAAALSGSASGFDALGKSVEGVSKQGNPLIRAFQGFHELVAENEIVKTAFAFNQVTGAIGELEHLARPVFEGLIAQNIELRQQILSVSATLAATQQVKVDGDTVAKPIDAIKAAGTAVSEQLNVLRTDSLSLAGVTSTELVGSFQAIAQASGGLGLNLKQAEKTTIALTAASTTLGLSEFQRSQEIQSIARGEITTYNQLAKSLGISNEIVRTKAAEGKLYEFIQSKTEALREAQGLAAQSFSGVTSNLKEIVQLTTQAAGAPLLDLLLKELNQFYEFIKEKQEALQNFSVAAVTAILDVVNPIITAFQPAIDNLGVALGNTAVALLSAFQNLTPIFIQVGTAIAQVVVQASQIVVQVSEFLKIIADLADPVTVTTLAVGALALATVLYRTELQALIATQVASFFTNLASNIALMGAALEGVGLASIGARFLTLGKAITTAISAAQAGGFSALIAELAPLALAAAAAAAPLIALAGAIALTGLVKYTNDLRVSNDELEEFGKQTDKVSEDSISLATKLKAAKDKTDESKKSGVALSKEELEANKKLAAQGKEQITQIDEKIASIKKFKAVGDEGRANQASQIKELEKMKETLSGLSSNITFDNKPLVERGKEFEQLENRVKAYQKTIDNPVDQAKFDEAAKGIIPLIKEEVEAGLISAEEGAKRLRKLAADTRADFELQKQAREAAMKEELTHQDEVLKISQANIEEQVGKGKLTQVDAEQQITEAKRFAAQERVEILKKEVENQPDNLQLRLQLEQAKTEVVQLEAKKREQAYKKELDERDRASKIAQANIDERVGKGAIGEIESEKETTALKAQEADKRLEIIRTTLEKENKEGRGKGEFAKQLTLQLEEAEGTAAKAAKAVRDLAFKQKLQEFDEQQRILEGMKAQGLVSEKEVADQSLDITQQRLDTELAQIRKQRATLTDAADIKELAAKEADINKRRVESFEKFENEKLAILERSQKKALDLVKKVETDSEIATQKLLNKREIREAEASDRNLKAKRKITEQELKLEVEKSKAIEALPQLTDPQKEEERQAKLRASRQRTGELTLSLLQNEREQQESTAKVIQDKIDQQLKAALNSYTEQEQGLQRLSASQDFLVKNLERQNSLLSAQKDLQGAISGYVNSEYQLAESLTQSESKKHKLREEAARSRLAFLDREQALERQSLDLEELKNKALLEREKIQNRIAQSKADAGLAKAIAEQGKTNADPKATAADKNAAVLAVQAAQEETIGTRYQGKLLDEQGQQQAGLDEAKRRSLFYKQDSQRDQARADLAKETRGKGDDRQLAIEFENKARSARFFDDTTLNIPQSNLPDFETFRKQAIQQQINRVTAPTQALIPQGFGVQQALPAGTGQAVATSEGGVKSLKEAIQQSIAQGFAKLGRLGNVNQTNSIVNNLNGADIANGKAAETVSQQILNQLYDVARLAKTKTAAS